ncbi:MAG: trypsin-like peptidase domain-containing protein [Marinilabiliales bacterium]|nr:trypsin-like peptidase domain-containing protein [Marinilabiliales bacterium]
MIKRFLVILLLIQSLSGFDLSGQVSYGGIPASFNTLKSGLPEIPFVVMSPVSNLDLIRMEKIMASDSKRLKFAKSFDVDISPDHSGVWSNSDGVRIWRVGIRSSGAYSLNLIFDKAIFPTGGSLFLYTPDHTHIRGAFNANNEQSSGMLPVAPLPGDELIVEYNEPLNASFHADLHISKVNHDYKNAIGSRPLGEAGLCNMDVHCVAAAVVQQEKQAVVQLMISGTDLCTGTLLNNTARDKAPYLLTAGHCILTAEEAQQTVFSFNYESPSCGKGAASINGFGDQSLTGALLKARSDSLDFALMELEMMPPPEYRPYYAGWDRSKTVPGSSRAIHHPKGDVKKVSLDYDSPGIGNYSSTGHPSNSFWWIKKWDVGTTEAGSSGGPLFSDTNLVIGSLTGGTASCDHSTDDYFSMFGFQWNYSNGASRQLKIWLDPMNTGESKLEGMDPYSTASTCDRFCDLGKDETYLASRLDIGKGYVSGHNSLKITNYAQVFKGTEQTTLSAFSVAFARATTLAANSSSTVTFNIYKMNANTGVPGEILRSVKVPIKTLRGQAENFFVLDNPLQIAGKYFIGYEINYSNLGDSVAVYHTAPRSSNSKNMAYCMIGGAWEPFYWVTEINTNTSLLISSYGCGNTLAAAEPDTIPVGEVQFKIYYPNESASQQLYLVNTGTEEFGRVSFYDVAGRKLKEMQRVLTTTPMAIDFSAFESAIYFIAVETLSKREVMKVRYIRRR